MKETRFVLEFTSHVLANGSNQQDDKDCFIRDSDKKIIFQQSWWYTALLKSINICKLKNIKPGDITVDLLVDAPTEFYNRKYGKDLFRIHEAIMPGTIVAFNAIVSDCITESILRQILDKMGTFVGLSPYGYNLGYGKFKVKALVIQRSE